MGNCQDCYRSLPKNAGGQIRSSEGPEQGALKADLSAFRQLNLYYF